MSMYCSLTQITKIRLQKGKILFHLIYGQISLLLQQEIQLHALLSTHESIKSMPPGKDRPLQLLLPFQTLSPRHNYYSLNHILAITFLAATFADIQSCTISPSGLYN